MVRLRHQTEAEVGKHTVLLDSTEDQSATVVTVRGPRGKLVIAFEIPKNVPTADVVATIMAVIPGAECIWGGVEPAEVEEVADVETITS